MKHHAYQFTGLSKTNPSKNDITDNESLTKKIAVFFTDIVGSTEFFKVYGDEHGREMLQNHYNTASSIITRFNGHIIKYIGDSIMAYFKDPLDALKAAIHLQQKTQTHNKKSRVLPVKIRVGIHYGNVLFEQEDIYGDVVNIASKLTNIADADKIYISTELYNQIKDTPFVHFEIVDHTGKKNVPDGLIFYSVTWDEELILDIENIIFFISPVMMPNNNIFYGFWKGFIKNDDVYLKDKIKRQTISNDDSLILYIKDTSWTLDVAKYLMDSLGKNIKIIKDMGFVPVYFVIDNVNDAGNDISLFEEYKKYISPGYIYISEDAFVVTGDIDIESIKKPHINAGSKRLYRLLHPEEKKKEVELFCYGYILTEGPYRPCFYCGSRKHTPARCSTKDLPEITGAISKLAYYPMDRINNLFFNLSILQEFQSSGALHNEGNHEQKMAYEAFFEPTRVFQLRFLKTIWNCAEQDWTSAKNVSSINEGGLIWLAYDSLRISDYKNVEACLEKAIENMPDNFRIYCIHGLLSIEKEDMENGEKYLKRAIKIAKNKIQKDYLCLLLARLYYLENRYNEAYKVINDVITQDPLCLDAYYLGIKIDLKMGKPGKATGTLMDLIQDNRDYFIYAFIDCELFPYRDIITETLEKIFKKAKQNAMEEAKEVEKEFLDTREFMNPETVSDLEGYFIKIKNLIGQNSFFGYLDASSMCYAAKSKIYDILKEKRKSIKKTVEGIYNRITGGLDQIKTLRYKRFANEYKARLEKLSMEIDTISSSIEHASLKELEGMHSMSIKIEKETLDIEERLETLVFLNKILFTLNAFTKYILFSLAMVFLLASFIIPFAAHHLNVAFSNLNLSTTIDEIDLKRYTFIWGGVLGFIFSIFASIRKLLKLLK